MHKRHVHTDVSIHLQDETQKSPDIFKNKLKKPFSNISSWPPLTYLLFASTKKHQLLYQLTTDLSRAGRSNVRKCAHRTEKHTVKLNVTNLWINFFTTSIPAFSSFKARMYS